MDEQLYNFDFHSVSCGYPIPSLSRSLVFFWKIVISLNSHCLSKDLLSVVLMAAEELVGSLVP